MGWLVIAPQMKTHVVLPRKSVLPSHRGFHRKSWTNLKMCTARPLGNHPLVHSRSFYTSSNTKLPLPRIAIWVTFKCEMLGASKIFTGIYYTWSRTKRHSHPALWQPYYYILYRTCFCVIRVFIAMLPELLLPPEGWLFSNDSMSWSILFLWYHRNFLKSSLK